MNKRAFKADLRRLVAKHVPHPQRAEDFDPAWFGMSEFLNDLDLWFDRKYPEENEAA